VLDGLFVQPRSKAVVFSQWTRTHHVVIRRLEQRGIGHVSFHGDVPADKRPALVQRFRDDPACRVFLSTDAGATGLNLQHASILVNMDLPWNQAILEQGSARIHRLGQSRPVQIVNFVAKGTIEEGMLGCCASSARRPASSMAASRTSRWAARAWARFMKEVEGVTRRIAESEAIAPADEAAAEAGAPAPPEAADGAAQEAPREGGAEAGVDPWAALLQMGSQLLSALAVPSAASGIAHSWIERDRATGASSLRIPLPPSETARRLADALSGIAGLLRGGSPGA
jgi:hypothetical protein